MTVSPMAIATRSRLTDRAHHVVLHDRRVDGGGALKVVLEEPQHVRLYSGGGGGTMSGGEGRNFVEDGGALASCVCVGTACWAQPSPSSCGLILRDCAR